MTKNVLPALPREIDPTASFSSLVDFIYDEYIIKRSAPGFVVGLSGTDSILAFLACAKAFEKAGKPDRAVGIHYGEKMPSQQHELDQRLQEDKNAFWFQREIIPWLKEQVSGAVVKTDSSIDYRLDGARWGALVDFANIEDRTTGRQFARGNQYWVVGTRNKTEQELKNFSNISIIASVQPLTEIWKSEILKLCEHLGVPKVAINKSRDADCICGRFQLPALYIENVDAILMTRKGLLSPSYIEQTMPTDLRADLEAFINKQIDDAWYKGSDEEGKPILPFRATADSITARPGDDEEYWRAKAVVEGQDSNTKNLSVVVPAIIKEGQVNAASDIVCTPSSNRTTWLPEALMLFNTPGLRSDQSRQMVENVFSVRNLSSPLPTLLSRVCARIGSLGFSFPIWRYLSQRYGENNSNPSLIEQFGMQRLHRDTDVRDATLSPADPNRDLFGPGFVWSDDRWYVEYRRAYIACSDRSAQNAATIVIRNNSYFYGRDRLPSPAYVSWQLREPKEIQDLTADQLESSGKFLSLQNMLRTSDNIPAADKVRRLNGLLDYLNKFDTGLSHWLDSTGPIEHFAGPDHSATDDAGGRRSLVGFLKYRAAVSAPSGKPGLYLSQIRDTAAPWAPSISLPLTQELISQLEKGSGLPSAAGMKIVLLTGENGDFPVIDKRPQILPAATLSTARP